ncbi:MAG: AIPR family protein [Phycisphaeraceae bacterium]
MVITEGQVAQAASELKGTRGGVQNDYFGLLFLEKEFKLPREDACEQIAYGGNDFGIDGYHVDRPAKNLHLFQFKFSKSANQFVGSMQRLIAAGLARVFDSNSQQAENPILREIKSRLYELKNVIDTVYIEFVFTGDPDKAQENEALQKLREDIQSRSYLTQTFFGRAVPIVVRFRSTLKRGPEEPYTPLTFELNMTGDLAYTGPDGQKMHVGFVRLRDLHAMFVAMKDRFLDRNIRSLLSSRKPGSETAVNRRLLKAFEEIMISRKADPGVFAFNHNGVTIFAEMIEGADGKYRVTEPRLLNGAQTVGSFDAFVASHKDDAVLSQSVDRLDAMRVMCKVIAQADPDFVTTVTICNNRQNPVAPWNLRANDMIQLQLASRFREELGLYYERQENAFEHFSDEELEEKGLRPGEAIELVRLAQTFLVTDGSIDKLSRMNEAFENDKSYEQVFSPSRLTADFRAVCLCYKVQFKLRLLVQSIVERGQNKYAYMPRARPLLWGLMCQAMLNHPEFDHYAESCGSDLRHPQLLMDWWYGLAANSCRLIIMDLVNLKENEERVRDGNFSFLKSNASFERAMEIGRRQNKWNHRRLK